MDSKKVLLRLSDSGEPISNGMVQNGVLSLPSMARCSDYNPGDVIYQLQLKLNAASKVSRQGIVYLNVTGSYSEPFRRNFWNEFPMESSFHQDITVEIPIYKPGAYCYFIKYEDDDGKEHKTDKFYFNLPPNLLINEKFVPFNDVNIQSLVSKWVGPLDNWDSVFKHIADKGYNMIHFTPLQQRGISNSPYSIYDQLTFDPGLFKSNDEAVSFIDGLLEKHNLLSLTDVVWNHTADNSDWIRSHPDAGYNRETAPNLIAAMELDKALFEFSENLSELGLPSELKTITDLNKIVDAIVPHVIEPLQFWQFYVFDRSSILAALDTTFHNHKQDIKPINIPDNVDTNNLTQLSQYVLNSCNVNEGIVLNDRFDNNLNPSKFLAILSSLFNSDLNGIEFSVLGNKAAAIVDEINLDLYKTYNEDVAIIKSLLADRIRYLRLDSNGPKLGKITKESPLTEAYFTRFTDKSNEEWPLANNGWIWGGDPLVDFASSKSKAYLRREVIVWSDCIKLRYGEKPEDSPYLWEHMIKYTQECARTFSGFRIDNCHSTPLHVGEALLDVARNVNPDLYVVAELFSGSEEMDKLFVESLGINSLIREAMQAWNVGELSRLVHKHGGRPIGSLTWLPLDEYAYPATSEPKSHTLEIPTVLTAQAPHALFMDCTHDNEMPAQKRTVEDTLPNAALVAFCSSAIGSVFGYDECYPELLNVVHETRQYTYGEMGIVDVKKKLHHIRELLVEEGEGTLKDHEMYIHHEDQYITIQRYNARTGKGWFLIARSKINNDQPNQVLSPVNLVGTKVKKEFACRLERNGDAPIDSEFIKPIPTELKEVSIPEIQYQDGNSTITVNDDFVPGSIAVFSTEIPGVDMGLDTFVKQGAIEASIDLDLYDLNAVLYRCEPEERDFSGGEIGTYNIPNYGPLVYAGLEGWISVLKPIIWNNDLAHPVCDHLRQGDWALDYVINRLDNYLPVASGLGKFQQWLKSRMDAIRKVPYFLRPHFFTLVVGTAYEACRFRGLRLLSKNIQGSTNFVQSLALTSIQMVGRMNNTSLKAKEQVPSLAAGLPHFSNDYMRCWGRDVFISFRGLLIVPERYEDAKQHILGFAQTLKHGLIPNLLDAGRNPRYNARDAAWFFLQAIQEYVLFAPDGESILDEKVARRFPLDDTYIPHTDERAFSYETSIRDIMFEIFQRHAKGIKYREANAGPNLDRQMKDIGFNVEVNVDWETGLIHGGQQFNCGTWMDKMGESELAGNKGFPGTPRDGAAIEIQGLLKSALRFIIELNKKGKFPYTQVEKANGDTIEFKQWETLVQENFEKCYYIPQNSSEDKNYNLDASIINRRGIYKDLYKTGKPYEDYQLRANFAIAMTVAPELFDIDHAYGAVLIADSAIRGPLGIKTLDPSDWNYRPYYRNSVDNQDFATAKGRNYHQGPEWVWCMGYFLRAYLIFNYKKLEKGLKKPPSINILTQLNHRIQHHITSINQSPWAGLTELTNKDGEYCDDSSPSQAWSTSCLLDLYFDLWKNLYGE